MTNIVNMDEQLLNNDRDLSELYGEDQFEQDEQTDELANPEDPGFYEEYPDEPESESEQEESESTVPKKPMKKWKKVALAILIVFVIVAIVAAVICGLHFGGVIDANSWFVKESQPSLQLPPPATEPGETQEETVPENEATGGNQSTTNLHLRPYSYNKEATGGNQSTTNTRMYPYPKELAEDPAVVLPPVPDYVYRQGFEILDPSKAEWTEGELTANALELTGGQKRVIGTNPTAAPGGAGPFSASVWFKTTKTGDSSLITWGLWDATGKHAAHVLINTSRNNRLVMGWAYGDLHRYDGVFPSDGEWHHMVWTFNGQAVDNSKIYYDGQLVSTATISVPDLIVSDPGSQVEIGTRSGHAPFVGTLEDPVLVDYEMTPAEVSALWNGGEGSIFT